MSDSTYKWFWSLFMAVKIFTLYDSVISLGNMSRYCSLFFKVYNAPHIVIQRRTDEWFHNSCLQCLDLLSDITTLFTRNLFWLAPSPSLLINVVVVHNWLRYILPCTYYGRFCYIISARFRIEVNGLSR